MDIKELYLSDINIDGEFWSQDKIDKLNGMFAQLAQGLPQGFQGSTGVSGDPGSDGTGGATGIVGITGVQGADGNQGEGLWKRSVVNNIDSIYTGSGSTSLIIGGASTLNTPSTCDDGTVVTNTVPITGATNPSTLRIHAIDDSTSNQRDHIKLIDGSNVGTIKFSIGGSDSHSVFRADKLTLSASNILLYDGSTAISAFTDSGITIHSDLTFDSGKSQAFNKNLTLTKIADDVTGSGGTVTNKFVTCNTGLTDGNAEFTDISSNFINFPVGSIIQINEDDYDEYFHTDYWALQGLTYWPTAEGFAMITGRGYGKYAGWYLCQEMPWRSAIGTTPLTQRNLPALNRVNSSVFGDLMPTTVNNTPPIISGADLDFQVDASGNMTMTETFNTVNTWWLGDYSGSYGHNTTASLSREIYICYLERADLFWYTDPATISSI